ncbi:MAG: V-type ATPase subunit [Ruminococcus sp.]|nr:V-type ATPase subunit [Ruminococcus sp.]
MVIQKDEYIYAVARIRCKENKLLSSKSIEQMISMNDIRNIERFLRDNGWGASSVEKVSDLLTYEQDNLWMLMKELVGELSPFDFLRIQNDFHNLKASIKAAYCDCSADHLFIAGSVYDPYDIYNLIRNREYNQLPELIRDTAQEAMNTLLRTGDGQLCDIIIDKACLACVSSLGKASDSGLIKEYCELFIASGNIRIAVRGSQLNKSADFILESMAQCGTLDIKLLASSVSKGFDELCSYLSSTNYKSSVPHIKASLSDFEKWCDNYIMELMQSQKAAPFTIGPLVSYIIAKQTEIKTVRLILTSKENMLPDGVIRERLRVMYV